MVIWPDFLHWDTATSATDTASAVARALGLRAKIDQETGLAQDPVERRRQWRHRHLRATCSGTCRTRPPTPATSTATTSPPWSTPTGFRFWGSRTCSDDPLFAFENYTRTAQVLADTMAEAQLWAIDKPMHPSLVRDMIEAINAKFRELKCARLPDRRRAAGTTRRQRRGHAEGRQAVHRLRLHPGPAAGRPHPAPAHHRPLPGRLRQPRQRLIALPCLR